MLGISYHCTDEKMSPKKGNPFSQGHKFSEVWRLNVTRLSIGNKTKLTILREPPSRGQGHFLALKNLVSR